MGHANVPVFLNIACYSLELYKCKVPFDYHEITIRVRLVHFFQPPLNLEYLATSYPHAPNVWDFYLAYPIIMNLQ